ncbi:hypothetical protein IMCC21906_01675 [Spongiibacter sp. IMCC21906]|jgi:hypothetical protein|uniref:DUF6489 family protein n=1 Tax=Spongiibacter sp. IMCC21906 TaxID=1620392 RepID=UPI00062DDFCD|nr:DUF6489 family protein [Spongiibacter sp. IMCC21906]AKH69351.1 hypothetical protein IMCC21906_01675 [Spongiibacter sp. IMCC21906]
MKINLEVELSPEELRRFIGLPDVQPFWDAVYKRVSDGDSEMIQQVAKTAFTEGLKTVDLSARILKSLSAYATNRRGADAEDDDEEDSPVKPKQTRRRPSPAKKAASK